MELMVAQFMALYANRTRPDKERGHTYKPSEFIPNYIPPDESSDDALLATLKLKSGSKW